MENNNNIDMTDRLKKFLKEENLQENEFARALNVTPSFINKVLNGNKKLPSVYIKLIYYIYGLNSNWLAYGIGNMYSDKNIYKEQEKKILTIFKTLNPQLQQLAIQYFKILDKMQTDIDKIFEKTDKAKNSSELH